MAKHKKTPTRIFTLNIGGAYSKTIISSQYAHSVVRAEFPDANIPGEEYGLGLRFYSPTWGWIYISWRETNEDDYS